jgi:hypothetical protein
MDIPQFDDPDTSVVPVNEHRHATFKLVFRLLPS